MSDALLVGREQQPAGEILPDREVGVTARIAPVERVVLAYFEPGTSLPLHYHTGSVDLWTLKGRWYHAEYEDQPQTTGCDLYEPGGSVHTLEVPADNSEETILLVRVEGTNIDFNEDASLHSLLDAILLRHLTDTLGAEQGVTPRYLEGRRHRQGLSTTAGPGAHRARRGPVVSVLLAGVAGQPTRTVRVMSRTAPPASTVSITR